MLTVGLIVAGAFCLFSMVMMIGNVLSKSPYGKTWALLCGLSVLMAGALFVFQWLAPPAETAQAASAKKSPSATATAAKTGQAGTATSTDASANSADGGSDLTFLANILELLKDGKAIPAEYLALLPDGGQSLQAATSGQAAPKLNSALQGQLVAIARSQGKTVPTAATYVPKHNTSTGTWTGGSATPSNTPTGLPSGYVGDCPPNYSGPSNGPCGGSGDVPVCTTNSNAPCVSTLPSGSSNNDPNGSAQGCTNSWCGPVPTCGTDVGNNSPTCRMPAGQEPTGSDGNGGTSTSGGTTSGGTTTSGSSGSTTSGGSSSGGSTSGSTTTTAPSSGSLLDGGLLKSLLGHSQSDVKAFFQYNQYLGGDSNSEQYLRGMTVVDVTYSGNTVSQVKLTVEPLSPPGKDQAYYEDVLRGVAGLTKASASSRSGMDVSWNGVYSGASSVKFHIDTMSNYGYVLATR